MPTRPATPSAFASTDARPASARREFIVLGLCGNWAVPRLDGRVGAQRFYASPERRKITTAATTTAPSAKRHFSARSTGQAGPSIRTRPSWRPTRRSALSGSVTGVRHTHVQIGQSERGITHPAWSGRGRDHQQGWRPHGRLRCRHRHQRGWQLTAATTGALKWIRRAGTVVGSPLFAKCDNALCDARYGLFP
jgi:hypothetical protein